MVFKRIAKTVVLVIAVATMIGAGAYLALMFIIKGEDTVVVPDLMGKNVVYALKTLSALGLNAKIKGSQHSPDIPKDHVIRQEPSAGAEIKKGRDVKFLISLGSETVAIPDLRGLKSQPAILVLEKNDLCQGVRTAVYHNEVKKDDIIDQAPAPNGWLKRGTCVDLLVSMGARPKAYRMPDLVGAYLDEAVFSLESMHLKVGQIKYSLNEGKPKNVILRHKPRAGYPVRRNSPVNLFVNQASAKTRPDPPGADSGVGLFMYSVKSGYLKKRIQIQVDVFGTRIDFFNDFVKPGREIWVLIPMHNGAVVSLYQDNELIRTEIYDKMEKRL